MKWFDNFIKKQYEKRFPKKPDDLDLIDPCVNPYFRIEKIKITPIVIKAMVLLPEEEFEANYHKSNFDDVIRRSMIDQMAGELQKVLSIVYDREPSGRIYRISGKLEVIPQNTKEGF